MCGILGNVIDVLINAICRTFGITEPCKVMVGCDNKSALWNTFGDEHVLMKMASPDLMQAGRYQMDLSPISWIKHRMLRGIKTKEMMNWMNGQ